jgi:hypothetical protein
MSVKSCLGSASAVQLYYSKVLNSASTFHAREHAPQVFHQAHATHFTVCGQGGGRRQCWPQLRWRSRRSWSVWPLPRNALRRRKLGRIHGCLLKWRWQGRQGPGGSARATAGGTVVERPWLNPGVCSLFAGLQRWSPLHREFNLILNFGNAFRPRI